MKENCCGKNEKTERSTWFCLLKGMAVAFAITCIVFIACGMLLTFTGLSESRIPVIALGCTAFSAAVAGYDWAECMKKRGLFWGMAAGAVYAVLLCFILSAASGDFSLHISLGMHLIVALAGGGVGGIFAMNRKK